MITNNNCNIIEENKECKSQIDIERSIQKKFRTKLWSPFIRGLKEFNMIENGDKIAVAISGGKDSLLLAKLLQELKRTKSTDFELHFISMNPGFNDDSLQNLKRSLEQMGIPSEIYDDNIFEVAERMSKEAPCYLCAKMRRGSLYTKATSLGCNKLALGHHFDDVVETIMINMFYSGSYKTMMPKLKSQNYDIELIRPLYYLKEKDIKRFVNYNNLSPMNCGCTVAAGKISSKREEIKRTLAELEKINPDIKSKILNSSKNINLNQCIQWKHGEKTFNFMDEY